MLWLLFLQPKLVSKFHTFCEGEQAVTERIKRLFFVTKMIDTGPDFLDLFENVAWVQFLKDTM